MTCSADSSTNTTWSHDETRFWHPTGRGARRTSERVSRPLPGARDRPASRRNVRRVSGARHPEGAAAMAAVNSSRCPGLVSFQDRVEDAAGSREPLVVAEPVLGRGALAVGQAEGVVWRLSGRRPRRRDAAGQGVSIGWPSHVRTAANRIQGHPRDPVCYSYRRASTGLSLDARRRPGIIAIHASETEPMSATITNSTGNSNPNRNLNTAVTRCASRRAPT